MCDTSEQLLFSSKIHSGVINLLLPIPMRPLSQLNIAQPAIISAIEVDESLFNRLSALGFRVGKTIRIIRRANFNGPLQVRLGTTDVILRHTDATRIHVNLTEH